MGADGFEGFEGAIVGDWPMGAEGVMGYEEAMGAEGTQGDEGAAMYILLDGYDTMGIGYIALWGFGAKSGTGWMGDGVDTP